jgi:hypothetical protein
MIKSKMMMMMMMTMMVCDHEYEYDDDDDDDDIQVSYFFISRRPLMQEVSTSFIAGGEHFLYLCYC